MQSLLTTALRNVTGTEFAKESSTLCMLMRVWRKRNSEKLSSTYLNIFALAEKILLEKLATNATWDFTVLHVTPALVTLQTTRFVEWEECVMMETTGQENAFV